MKPMEAIANILEVDEDSISPEDLLENLESWDSLAALSFIAIADSDFDKAVTGKQLEESKSIADLVAILTGH
jgi:acyl carrier protein